MTKLIVTANAPTRIDLAGGTIDLWPIHQLLTYKATVNVAIDLDAQATVSLSDKADQFELISDDQNLHKSYKFHQLGEQRDELYLLALLLRQVWNSSLPAIQLRTRAKSPAGAGLGGSSCLAVSVLSALYAAREQLGQSSIPNEYELVQTAQDIEARVIRAPTGVQDYWGGIRGGINAIEFQPGRTRVNTFEASAVPSLEESMIVCYSGQSRQSAINNWEVFKRVFDGDQSLIQRLELIGREAESCAVALKSGDLSALLEHSQREWKLRVGLWPNIETERTRRIDLAAQAAGARFSRVCGAGGGGVMVIFADANIRAKVVAAATGAGGEILPAKISPQGVRLKFN